MEHAITSCPDSQRSGTVARPCGRANSSVFKEDFADRQQGRRVGTRAKCLPRNRRYHKWQIVTNVGKATYENEKTAGGNAAIADFYPTFQSRKVK